MKKVFEILPDDVCREVNSLKNLNNLTEIRLRVGKKIWFAYGKRQEASARGRPFTKEEAEVMWKRLCEGAPYSKVAEQQNGYITSEGCRVGFGGKFSGTEWTLKYPGSFCVRICREIKGCGEKIYPMLFDGALLQNTLIVSPPGYGKTTLLRDIVRLFSSDGYNVSLLDDREEISAPVDGVPLLNVGEHTDIIYGLERKRAMENALRGLKPDIIALDELGNDEDTICVKKAITQGVCVLATAHGKSVGDVGERLGIAFDRYAVMEKWGSAPEIYGRDGKICK